MALSERMRSVLSSAPFTGMFVDSQDDILNRQAKQALLDKANAEAEEKKRGLSRMLDIYTTPRVKAEIGMAEREPIPVEDILSGRLDTRQKRLDDIKAGALADQSIYGDSTVDEFHKTAQATASLRKPEDALDKEHRTEERMMRMLQEQERLRQEAEQRAEQRKLEAEERKNAQIPPDKAGLYTLANESIGSIQDVRRMLFPDGTPRSFDRGAATAGSLRMFGGAPLSQAGQELFRKMSTALSGRQLITTGVAARPEETQSLYKAFMAGAASNPVAAFNALNQLEKFYSDYNTNLKTKGLGGGQPIRKYPSDAAVKAAIARGEITREQGIQILQQDFGYGQ